MKAGLIPAMKEAPTADKNTLTTPKAAIGVPISARKPAMVNGSSLKNVAADEYVYTGTADALKTKTTAAGPNNASPSVSSSSFRNPVKIDFDDIIDEVYYWESAVVCFVLGANPPLPVMEGYVNRIWKELSIDKIVMVAKGVYLVRFLQQHDKTKAYDMNGFMFDKNPFIVVGSLRF